MEPTASLQGRVAIVTGASGSGVGRSTALTLAREGAAVVVSYHSAAEAAAQVANHIQNRGGTALAVQADVFDPEGCRHLIETTVAQLGRVDIGIINPGGGWHPEALDALEASAALDDVQREVAPVLHLMTLLLPRMYAEHWGRIIAVGLNPALPSPAYAYNIAKAARLEAVIQAQNPAWSHGVTVNVVAPGPVANIDTVEEAIAQSQHAESWRNRPTTSPQDIAESIAFLCSEAGRFVTGAVVPFQFT